MISIPVNAFKSGQQVWSQQFFLMPTKFNKVQLCHLKKLSYHFFSHFLYITLSDVNILCPFNFLVCINAFEKVSMTVFLGTCCNQIALG